MTLWSGPSEKIFSAEAYVLRLFPREIVTELSEAAARPNLFIQMICEVIAFPLLEPYRRHDLEGRGVRFTLPLLRHDAELGDAQSISIA